MGLTPVSIERARAGALAEVARIYAEGIATGDATFETEVPAWERWDAGHLAEHRFVAVRDGTVVGFVAVSAVSDRCVYGGVVENSVYVAATARGAGVGRLLLERLIASTEARGDLDDPEPGSSRRTRRACACTSGSASSGRAAERLGRLRGVWRDVLLVERRSEVIG